MSFFDRTGAGLCSAGETVRPALEIADADGVLIDLTGRTFRYVVIDGDGLVLCDVPAPVAGTRATAELSGADTLDLAGLVGLEHFFTEQVEGGRRDWLRARLTVRRDGPVLTGAIPGGSDAVRVSERGVMRVVATGAPGLPPWQAAGQTLEEYTGDLAQPALDAAAEARDAVANFQATGARVYRSTAEASAATLPGTVSLINVYDRGPYVRSIVAPTDPDSFTTADGSFWTRAYLPVAATQLTGPAGSVVELLPNGIRIGMPGETVLQISGGGITNIPSNVENASYRINLIYPTKCTARLQGESDVFGLSPVGIYQSGFGGPVAHRDHRDDGTRLNPIPPGDNAIVTSWVASVTTQSDGLQAAIGSIFFITNQPGGVSSGKAGGVIQLRATPVDQSLPVTQLDIYGDGIGSAAHKFYDYTSGLLKERSYTAATLPPATAYPGRTVRVSNVMGGVSAYSDGSDWMISNKYERLDLVWAGAANTGTQTALVRFDGKLHRISPGANPSLFIAHAATPATNAAGQTYAIRQGPLTGGADINLGSSAFAQAARLGGATIGGSVPWRFAKGDVVKGVPTGVADPTIAGVTISLEYQLTVPLT